MSHAHPTNDRYVTQQEEGWPLRLREALLSCPTALVGEAGLDRARLDVTWEAQMHAFACQLDLAAELQRPLVVHCVRADEPRA